MGLTLGARALPLPSDFMETPSSRIGKGVGVHKRAYAKLRYVGRSNKEGYVVGCPNDSVTSIESNVQQTHSNLLSTEGGRLTPRPVLESVSMANDGGQDLSDAMLFELSVVCKVYNKNDFDAIDQTFFTPGHRCEVDIGWVGGEAVTVRGDVCGFDFSINQDLSYDVTIKIGGMTDGVKGADLIFGKGVSFSGLTYTDPEDDSKEITPTDIISALTAASTLNNSEAIAGTAREYSNNQLNSKFVTVKHIQDEGGWSNFWGTNRESMDYINLQSLIGLINKNVKDGKVFGENPFEFDIKYGKNNKMDKNIFSADPYTMLLSHSTNALEYGPKAKLTGAPQGAKPEENIYLSIAYLQTQYDQLKNPPTQGDDGGENKEKAVSTVKYLQTIFNKIKDCSGGYIRLYFYSDPSKEGVLTVANRGNNVSSNFTKISMTNGFENGIRDIGLTSNLDSDMIGLATNAAMSGKYSSQLGKLYPKCYRKPEDGQKNETGPSAEERLTESKTGLGDRISEDDVTTAKSALKTYVQGLNEIPTLTYSLEATVKFDGYASPDGGPKYGDAFQIDRLPSRMNTSNIFFIVTKIANDYSAGDWTTTVTGLMMVGK